MKNILERIGSEVRQKTAFALCAAQVLSFVGCGFQGKSGSSPGQQSSSSVAAPPPSGSNGSGGNTVSDAPGNWYSTCGDIANVASGKYCVYQNSPNPKSTIWFFHGLADSEHVFRDAPTGGAIYSSYVDLLNGLPSIKIVQISYGLSWLITGYPNRTLDPANATLDVFTTQIMPFIESNFQLPKPYMLMGHSMGGFNTSTLCASLPQMWSKCVLLNAMLPSCDPFSWTSICNPGPGLVVKGNFDGPTYLTNQPAQLLKNLAASGRKLPKTFVTACAIDGWGLYDGPKAWTDLAIGLGFDVTWDPIATGCDHAHWPAQHVINFLASQ